MIIGVLVLSIVLWNGLVGWAMHCHSFDGWMDGGYDLFMHCERNGLDWMGWTEKGLLHSFLDTLR